MLSEVTDRYSPLVIFLIHTKTFIKNPDLFHNFLLQNNFFIYYFKYAVLNINCNTGIILKFNFKIQVYFKIYRIITRFDILF